MSDDTPKREAAATTVRGTGGEGRAPKLLLSSSPHINTSDSVARIMYTVVIALVPASAFAVYSFGWDALRVLVLGVVGCMATEWVLARITKQPFDVNDGSAAVTGILLALNLPSSAPWWLGGGAK